MSKLLCTLFGPVLRYHRGLVATSLARYGLRFDDVRNETDPDVAAALLLLPPEELSDRNKRLKRATDLGLKRTYLAAHVQEEALKDVWKSYLAVEQCRKERLEKETY